MTTPTHEIIRFDTFELDLTRSELRNSGQPVDVEPQVFALISFFASHPGQVLSRDQIIDQVWNGRIVSDSAISTRINAARTALSDDGKSQRVIKTVSRRGFIFLPETNVGPIVDARGEDLPESGPKVAEIGRASDRPSIVVLPFDNLSGDPAQSFFSDGITDDIITDLSRYRELFVIARQSAFAFGDAGRSALDFADELGVAYVLEGSVRRHQDRVRVTAQLIDVQTKSTLWADRFNRKVEDIFDVQEEIATVIVNTLIGQVSLRHYRQIQKNTANAISAYEHSVKAQQQIWKFSRESAALARQEAEMAIQLEPDFARAHAILGWAHHIEGSNGWGDNLDNPFDLALEHAKSAVAADPNEPWGHCVLGFTLWWRGQARDFGRGLEEVQHAARLNPSNAHFRMIVGATLAYMGKGDEALSEIDAAMRFNPLFPSLYLIHRSRALFVSGRYEEALSDAEKAAIEMPSHANVLALLAVCYTELGRKDQASSAIKALRQASPSFTVDYVRKTLPFAQEKDLDRMCQRLAEAGLPN